VVDQVGGSWEWTEAAPAPAPKAVVEQVATVPMALDVDAMFDAMASLDGEADDTGAAEMKRVYLQKAEENVAKSRMIRVVPHKLAPRSDARCSERIHRVKQGTTAASATLDPCVVQIVQGMSPAGQNFRVQLSQGARRGAELETVDDDGGSPVNLISPTKAALLIEQNLARPLPGKSLYDHFSSVVSASGHDLGYTGDLKVTIPSRLLCPAVCRGVSGHHRRGGRERGNGTRGDPFVGPWGDPEEPALRRRRHQRSERSATGTTGGPQ
jgi:hypothetical protein